MFEAFGLEVVHRDISLTPEQWALMGLLIVLGKWWCEPNLMVFWVHPPWRVLSLLHKVVVGNHLL
jgi:hypothetical protein